MTNKIGEIVSYGCTGGKGISVQTPPYCSTTTIQLPDCMNHIPVGFIAYIDDYGKLAFMEEDPHDYEDRGES